MVAFSGCGWCLHRHRHYWRCYSHVFGPRRGGLFRLCGCDTLGGENIDAAITGQAANQRDAAALVAVGVGQDAFAVGGNRAGLSAIVDELGLHRVGTSLGEFLIVFAIAEFVRVAVHSQRLAAAALVVGGLLDCPLACGWDSSAVETKI